ncbi:hypothetical protein HO133_010956 [Letharia lupina]|uniref:Uncharacterized protein n=1 Tax=Letharia lupina TaxID=560253 RepID=A0A8H6CJK9_9LECA|nr:uncharacterized protein HO133_010956 [Letharia lupina]KAF6224379.1 hypothetical protein HO133_010956 [Letharia lupina]
MPPFFKLFHQLPMLLAILNLRFLLIHATPTSHASQLSSLSNDLSPRTQPLYSAALTSHPKRAQVTKGTFYRGLWSLALTTATFLAQGPSSSVAPASDVEFFAQQILDKVATRIATGATEKTAFGWGLEGISIAFASWIDPVTNVAPGVPVRYTFRGNSSPFMLCYESSGMSQEFSAPKTCLVTQNSTRKSNADSEIIKWEVVQEFVTRFVLWRAQRGTVLAFSGNIWGPGGQCIKIVLEVAGTTGFAEVASNILDSASEIHGGG